MTLNNLFPLSKRLLLQLQYSKVPNECAWSNKHTGYLNGDCKVLKAVNVQNKDLAEEKIAKMIDLHKVWAKRMGQVKNWPCIKNPQFSSHPYEIWKWLPHMIIFFTKFHEDWTKIVDFLLMGNFRACPVFLFRPYVLPCLLETLE